MRETMCSVRVPRRPPLLSATRAKARVADVLTCVGSSDVAAIRTPVRLGPSSAAALEVVITGAGRKAWEHTAPPTTSNAAHFMAV